MLSRGHAQLVRGRSRLHSLCKDVLIRLGHVKLDGCAGVEDHALAKDGHKPATATEAAVVAT